MIYRTGINSYKIKFKDSYIPFINLKLGEFNGNGWKLISVQGYYKGRYRDYDEYIAILTKVNNRQDKIYKFKRKLKENLKEIITIILLIIITLKLYLFSN